MTVVGSFSLTEYTNFRQLEFEFVKMKDENEMAKQQLRQLEECYRQSLKQIELKQYEISRMSQLNKEQQKRDKLILKRIEQQLKQRMNRLNKRLFNEEDQLTNISEYLTTILDNYEQQQYRLRRIIEQQQTKNAHLNQQLNIEENKLKELHIDYNNLEYQYEAINGKYYQLGKIYEELLEKYQKYMRKEEEGKNVIQPESIIEDQHFTNEILHYQHQLLNQIFTRIIHLLKHTTSSPILTDIYLSYQSLAEAYREKLQVQYDLEDLEQKYKIEKNNKNNTTLLIQLRKQIEEFRNQLQNQKNILSEQEGSLERHLKALEDNGQREDKLRRHTMQIERKMKQIDSYQQTKRNNECNIKFEYRINNEELNQIIKKDRENIQRIFKEQRNQMH